MNINDVKEMVKSDLGIDQTALDTESSRTPQLHNKYLVIFMDERIKLKRLENELSVLRRNKWLYYTGRMSKEELVQFNWEPFELNVLKTEANDLIDSDDEYIRMSQKTDFQKEIVNYLEGVVKIVQNRQWQIRAMIDWIKFSQGA
jgi:ABC-type enterochelin transport system ATPase subunit